MAINIRGSKGKGGGSGYRAPVEEKNSLQSIQYINLIDVISEGPIVGLVGNDNGIYLNETKLRADNGALTLEDVSWSLKTGTPEQSALPYDSGAETEIGHGVEVPHLYPKGTGSAEYIGYSFTITNELVTRLRITLSVQGLYETKDDQEHAGDVVGAKVGYRVVIKDGDNRVIKNYANTLSGKTTAAYQWALNFALTGPAPWTVTITKTTDDSTSSLLQNDLYVSSHTEIIGYSFTYPHTAMVAITASAEAFNSSVPARVYRVKGMKIKVPSNYDPETRQYNGTWNGTFKLAWTDNPAWVFYDLVNSDRYGVAKYLPYSFLENRALCDKWFLYDIARLCDEQVPDGFGGYEPRYTFNYQVMGGGDAKEVLQSIASVFHGMSYWSAGLIYARADYPTDPIRTITQANTIDGRITYATASMAERHSVALVTWYDPADMGKAHIEAIYDWELYKSIGYRPIESVAYGCYSRGQAHRHGLWLLASEKDQWTASLEMGLDAFDLLPGDLVKIADPAWMGYRASGRIKAISGNTVTLDAPFDAESGQNYQISICDTDGKEETRDIIKVAGAVITVSSAFTHRFVDSAVWSISGTDARPRVFRVQNIKETERATVAIDLIEYDVNKFKWIEDGLKLEEPPSRSKLKADLIAPDILNVTETTATVNARLVQKAIFSWAYTTARFDVVSFQVRYVDPLGRSTNSEWSNESTIELQNVIAGDWTFQVRSRTFDGRISPWGRTTHSMAGISGLNPINPTGLKLEEWGYLQKDGVHISNIDVTWNASTMAASANDGYSVYYRYSSSGVWQLWGQTDAGTNMMTLENVLTNKTIFVMVKTRSKLGISSTGISTSLLIVGKDAMPPAPTALNVVQNKQDRTQLLISWEPVNSRQHPDIAGYRVYLDGAVAVALATDNNTVATMTTSGQHAVVVVSVDNSQQESVRTASHVSTYSIRPEDVQNFAVQQASYERTTAIFTWQPVAGEDIDFYEIREGSTAQAWQNRKLIARTQGDRYELRLSDENEHTYWIVAHCVGGTYSAVPQSVRAVFDLNPTPPSELLAVKDLYDSTRLNISWKLSPDLDVIGYEVRDGAIWASAAVLGTTSANSLSVTVSKSHEFNIMVKAKNKAGFESAAVHAFCEIMLEPANVQGFQVVQDGASADFLWDKNPESDIAGYEIREGFSWDSAQTIATGITQTSYSVGIAFERGYRYMIKAINRAGFESAQPATAVLIVNQLPPKNVLLSWDDVAALDGNHNGTIWAENPASWQTVGGRFSDYETMRWQDFGGRFALTLEPGRTEGEWVSDIRDTHRLISAILQSDFITLNREQTKATLEFRTSQDGETWTAWKLLTPHQESLRYLQYRVRLSTEDVNVVPWVTVLLVVVDMPDVVKAGRESVPVEGANISYQFEYALPPTVVLTADGADKRAIIVGQPNVSECSVLVVDSVSGNAVEGVINWTSYGY